MEKDCFKIFMGLKDSSGWLSNSPKICTMGPNWILICIRINTLQFKRYFQYYWSGSSIISFRHISSNSKGKKKKSVMNFWKLLLAPLYTTNVVVWRGGGRRIRQINASLGGTLGCCPSSFKQAKLNEHFLDFPTTRGLNSDYSLPRRAWESNKTEAGVKLSECVNRDYSVPGQNTLKFQ